LRFAIQLSPEVHAVQVLGARADCRDLSGSWPVLVEAPLRAAGIEPPRLTVLPSSYRRLYDPLIRYVQSLCARYPDREIAVVVPELVERKWYHALLHTHRATVLTALLILKGGPRVIVMNTPWYLRGNPACRTGTCQ
jgi:hypothetical protein